jgi:hypothetical protein
VTFLILLALVCIGTAVIIYITRDRNGGGGNDWT